VWVQEMYGTVTRYVGAGHGFAGNSMVLLAQWPALADQETPRKPVQWCHGSPGIVTSLRALPADPQTDALLAAGGELTWRAGPLRKGVGLCHGTAGNAFALLALHARTGDELWLQRARAFAMDAAADAAARRQTDGRGRYSLFTGDAGVALLLRACLTADPRFPFLEDAL
jgi:hypothetical protein